MKTLIFNPHRRRKGRKHRRRARMVRNPHKTRKAGRRRRGGFRRGSGNGGGLKGIFSRQNLMIAGGVAGATFLAGWLTTPTSNADGTRGPAPITKLPGISDATTGEINKTVLLAYLGGIPVAAGFFLRKTSPPAATGLLVGGLATLLIGGINLIKAQAAPARVDTSGFDPSHVNPDGTPKIDPATGRAYISGIGEYFDAGGYRVGYNRRRAFGASPYDSANAFSKSAW